LLYHFAALKPKGAYSTDGYLIAGRRSAKPLSSMSASELPFGDNLVPFSNDVLEIIVIVWASKALPRKAFLVVLQARSFVWSPNDVDCQYLVQSIGIVPAFLD
jgi:hypothetical protein